jgi:redox-sensitive bicupin YhaK (pirin superfamily)
VTARVIAGSSNGIAGVVDREMTEPLYLDIHLPAGATFSTAIPNTHNAFVYVYRGSVEVDNTLVECKRMGILSNSPVADGITLTAHNNNTRLILIAGKPLHQPIVQYGPFVMNTVEEIQQAIDDYRNGNFA